jgi:ligand-binding SRPBCC domain-containing protein
MDEFTLNRSQLIDRPIDEVFSFFADAKNLGTITPGWLDFRIATRAPIEMTEGVVIDYTLKLRGIPVRWQSEITAWEPPFRFVDEQRRGPYRYWIHEHEFEAVGETSTLVRDHVRYGVPGGTLVHKLFVEPDLERVFSYRAKKLDEIFHGKESTTQ